MNRSKISVISAAFVLLLVLQLNAQTTAGTQGGDKAVVGHGAFPAKTLKNLDSSKLKSGDRVEVETTGSFKLPDGTLVPKGSKLVGHVANSSARSKGDQTSQLALEFENISISGGKQMAIKGSVQAVFPPADQPDPGMPFSTVSKGAAPMSGGGMSQMPTPGYQPTDIKSGSDPDRNTHVDPVVDPKSSGVHGIKDLTLEDGTLRSNGKQVKLESGLRIIVHADIY